MHQFNKCSLAPSLLPKQQSTMAQIKSPLSSEDARGKFGENLVFTHFGNSPVARKFVTPNNPKTALQQAHRAKFKAAQSMFQEGFDDYNTILTGASQNDINAYLGAVSDYKQSNPVAPKKFAAGFESLSVPQRAYAIGHAMRGSLECHRRINNNILNDSGVAIKVLAFDIGGSKVNEVAIPAGDNAALPAGSVAIAVSDGATDRSGITSLATLAAAGGIDENLTELIVVNSMGQYN